MTIQGPWKAKDIGLKLFTTEEKGWPQKTHFGYKDLKDGLVNKTYKWTFDDTNYSEEEVFEAIVEGNIRLIDCWHAIDKGIFRKLRSGCTKERSPLQQRDPRMRKLSDS